MISGAVSALDHLNNARTRFETDFRPQIETDLPDLAQELDLDQELLPKETAQLVAAVAAGSIGHASSLTRCP